MITDAVKKMSDEELRKHIELVGKAMNKLEDDLEQYKAAYDVAYNEEADRGIKRANPEWWFGMELGDDHFLSRGPGKNYHGEVVWGITVTHHGIPCGYDFQDAETVTAARGKWLEAVTQRTQNAGGGDGN